MVTLCSPHSVTFVNTLTIEGIGYVLYPAVLIRCSNNIGHIIDNYHQLYLGIKCEHFHAKCR